MLPSSASQRVNLDGGTNNVHPGSFSLVGPRTRPQFNGIDIIREADEFAMIHGLNKDQILIKKGALVYHDPDNGAGVEGLTPDELAALSDKSREKVNTFKLKGWTSYTCYMAIILYASLQYSSWQLLGQHYRSTFSLWLSCAPWLGSALFGCIISVPLNGRFGRRGSIFTATSLALFSALVRVVLPSWRLSYTIFAAHLTAGTAMGILRCTCPLYLAETSFTSTRGSRIAIWQVHITTMAISLLTEKEVILNMISPGVRDVGLLFTFVSGVTLLCLITANKLPESPYWCILNGKMQDALDSLCHFRKAEIVAARDLHQIHSTLGELSSTQDFQKDFSFLRALKHSQFKRAALASIPMILTLNMSAVQVAHADFWYKTLPMLNRINFEPTIAIFPMIFVWLLAGRLDEIGRRRSAMALILLMLLSMQIPVVEFTGDPASMVSSVSQILLITLYQTVELVFSVYTAEVFPWQYNAAAQIWAWRSQRH
ncbi:hypothetical protein N7455_001070 [Penicillium solitum]|uniref:uncharacterized protein n=1 Tax=Penicillium solitum TaxID=60172 RepID=UPI0032C4269E|nr:hypothetical protein N7455_001070 [Penicillium solitum]